MVCDDDKGPDWDEIVHMPAFSRDSKRFCYQAVNGGAGFIVIAGQADKRQPTRQAKRAIYAPVGKGFAYWVRGDKGCWVVRDGKEGPHYHDVTLGRFSPDGKRLYYIATDDKKTKFAILDGAAGRGYDSVRMGAFSPDSKHLAYTAGRGGKTTVVCDGKEGVFHDETVHYPLFSPDGKGLAYWTRTKDCRSFSVVWNEKVVARITGEPQLVFSPDGKELAWGTYRGDVYRCGKEAVMIASGHDAGSRPTFSPDGKHMAYAVGKDMKWRVCVDGKALVGIYDAADVLHWSGASGGGAQMILSDRPVFSACGRHIFFKGTRKNKNSRRNRKQFIVVNGVEGPEHDDVWIPDDFKKNPKRLRYVVRDGVQIRLVETPWPKPLVWSDTIEPAGK
jgi:hypothetical protein